jgi:energy-coupling factor transporter ATP-binding protein EcfA2
MTVWETYPQTYRQAEVRRMLRAVRGGECVSLVGLSGAGKSNLLGFLAHRVRWEGRFVLLDLNRLAAPQADALLDLMRRSLDVGEGRDLEIALGQINHPLCLLLDRFDALVGEQALAAARQLRALRDAHKYQLTLVTATRCPLDVGTELAELVFANTLVLGKLSPSDAVWNVRRYAQRLSLDWNDDTILAIRNLSGDYPALLRATCEAHAAGCPLQHGALRQHPAVRQRLDEFWHDQPSPTLLRQSGLDGLPLIRQPDSPPRLRLSAKEKKLFEHLQEHAGQLCEKDDLIRAVWPEDAIYERGVRDSSLAQLVSRLRRKIHAAYPGSRIENLPGQGYLLALGDSA